MILGRQKEWGGLWWQSTHRRVVVVIGVGMGRVE